MGAISTFLFYPLNRLHHLYVRAVLAELGRHLTLGVMLRVLDSALLLVSIVTISFTCKTQWWHEVGGGVS